MIECPQPGCSGTLEDLYCSFCGQVASLAAIWTRFPTPDRVVREQEEREDLALRGVT